MTSWIATTLSLVASTIAAAFYANGGHVHNLLRSDDHFIGGFAVAVLSAGCFVTGAILGWLFDSRSVAFRASFLSVAVTCTLMILADYLHHFEEGDEFLGALGLGLAIGGSVGMFAFGFRRRYFRVFVAIALTLLWGVCFLIALSYMSVM